MEMLRREDVNESVFFTVHLQIQSNLHPARKPKQIAKSKHAMMRHIRAGKPKTDSIVRLDSFGKGNATEKGSMLIPHCIPAILISKSIIIYGALLKMVSRRELTSCGSR